MRNVLSRRRTLVILVVALIAMSGCAILATSSRGQTAKDPYPFSAIPEVAWTAPSEEHDALALAALDSRSAWVVQEPGLQLTSSWPIRENGTEIGVALEYAVTGPEFTQGPWYAECESGVGYSTTQANGVVGVLVLVDLDKQQTFAVIPIWDALDPILVDPLALCS